MERTVQFLLGVSVCIALSACSRAHPSNVDAAQIRAKLDAIPLDQKVDLTNKEWLVILSPQQFYVMRRAGTELPSLSGNALDHHNGFTFARRAAIRFTARRRNSIRAPAGRVSGSRSAKKRFTRAARPRRSSEWKFRAPVADRISDMSSMTDRRQLNCATV